MIQNFLKALYFMGFKSNLKIHKIFIPLLFLSNVLANLITPHSELFDSALFKLQFVYPTLGFEPYKDFFFIYPFGPSLISIFTHKLTYGLVNPLNLIWIIHFILQIILVKKILQNNITTVSKIPFLYLTLIVETLIYAKLGSEPFSLILTFATLIEFYKSYKNNKIYLSTFIFPTLLVFFKWERLLFCTLIILLFFIIRRSSNFSRKYSSLIKILLTSIISFLLLLLSFYLFDPDNFKNILTYVFIDPFIIAKYRSLPFVINKPILSAYNLYYFVLIFYGIFFWILFFTEVNYKKIFFYCVGLSLLPPTFSRSDVGHFIPFYFSSFFLIYSLPSFVDKYLAKYSDNLLFIIKLLSLFVIAFFYITVLNNQPLKNSCANLVFKSKPKSIFVGNSQYDRFNINFPLLYLNYSHLKPATKYISDEPGLQNSCAIQDEIINDINLAPKPTIFFINNTLLTDKNNSVSYVNCKKIEEYLISNTKIIGKCNLSDYNLDIRISE
jgi:hypothetical protein